MAEWTIDTVREHLLERINAEREHAADRLQAHENEDWQRHAATHEAASRAAESIDRRLEGMNEFRSQLSDQAATFLTRSEYDAKHSELEVRVEIGTKNLHERLEDLRVQVTAMAGRSVGIAVGWAYLSGAIGLAGVLIGIFIAIR